jgi:O-antigen/teichoic acid export membrane protein
VNQGEAPAPERRFSRNVVWSAASLLVFSLAGSAWAVMTADGLGPEGKGVLSLVGLVLMLGGLACSLGTSYTMPALLGVGAAGDGPILASAVVVAVALNLAVIAGIAAIGAFTLGSRALGILLFGAATLLPFSWLKTIAGSALTAHRAFRELFFVTLPGQAVQVCGAALLLTLHHMNVFLAIAANATGAALTAAASIVALRRWTGRRELRVSRAAIRSVTRAAFAAQPGILAQSMNYRLDLFVVVWLSDNRVVGVYAVAVFLAEVLFYPAGIVGQVLLPRAAREGSGAEPAYRIVMTFTLLLGIAMWFAAPPLVHLLFSARFSEAAGGVRALLPGVLALSLWQLGTFELAGRGRLVAMSVSAVTGIAATFLSDAFLVPRYGVVGASLGASVGYAATVAAVIPPLRRRLNYRIRSLLLVRRSDLTLAAREVAHVISEVRLSLAGVLRA